MDRDETHLPHRHFRDRMAETGASRHRPKVCLVAIKAARNYREALDAAAEARRALIEATVHRAPDDRAALAVLNHLADSFQLPPFADAELADEE
jgi:hypothetical protein